VNSQLSIDGHAFSTADLQVEVPRPASLDIGLSRAGSTYGSRTLTKKKGLKDSVGLIVTVAVHVVALALLLSNRVQTVEPPRPIMAKVITEAAPQQKDKPKPMEPMVQKPRLETPPPELFIASETPAPIAPLITHSAPKKEEPTQQVDSQPKFDADYLNNPSPTYPKLSKQLHEQGTTLVLVHVQPDGLPDQIELKRSSGSARLDQSALAAVKHWKFVPATSGGKPVAAWVVVPLEFSLNG